jgi:hypothetical protein
VPPSEPARDDLPITVLLPGSAVEPIVIYDSLTALRMAVVERAGAHLLGAEWDIAGDYVLLDPVDAEGDYGAYVGQAPAGLRGRLVTHLRGRDHWRRAVLIAKDTTFGFHSAHAGWLEGRLWELLNAAEHADLHNSNRPKDETLPAYDRLALEACVVPISRVLRLLGYVVESPGEEEASPAGRRPRTHHGITVAELVAEGLLPAGSRLTSTNGVYPASARVASDGSIDLDGTSYPTPSAAAAAVRGGAANGWDFWAVDVDGRRTPLASYRARLLERRLVSGGGSPA